MGYVVKLKSTKTIIVSCFVLAVTATIAAGDSERKPAAVDANSKIVVTSVVPNKPQTASDSNVPQEGLNSTLSNIISGKTNIHSRHSCFWVRLFSISIPRLLSEISGWHCNH